jgi:ATP-dependent protease ClpP protease subunit
MRNDFYKFTMAQDQAVPARLDLFGTIGGGFWDDGFDDVSFAEAMKGVGEFQPLDIYINSPGGSVFAAISICNLIARHKGTVTVHVSGIAASAATIITSVPNGRVIMPLGSMMLIHPVRAAVGSSTAEELREAGENLEKVRESVLDIYAQKTGLGREVLLGMMQKESYLTAGEAVEFGFADEVDNSVTVENVISGGVCMINGLEVSASLFDAAPKGFIKQEVKMDLENLTKEYPELVEQIRAKAYAEGADSERARILAIEEIATPGHDELVKSAKLDSTMSAEKLAVEILKADKARNANMLQSRVNDAQDLANIPQVSNEGVIPGEEKKAKEDAEEQKIIEAGRRGFLNALTNSRRAK